jgi:hypothetical protein
MPLQPIHPIGETTQRIFPYFRGVTASTGTPHQPVRPDRSPHGSLLRKHVGKFRIHEIRDDPLDLKQRERTLVYFARQFVDQMCVIAAPASRIIGTWDMFGCIPSLMGLLAEVFDFYLASLEDGMPLLNGLLVLQRLYAGPHMPVRLCPNTFILHRSGRAGAARGVLSRMPRLLAIFQSHHRIFLCCPSIPLGGATPGRGRKQSRCMIV